MTFTLQTAETRCVTCQDLTATCDPDLLRRYPNYRSRFHLPNERCGRLLQTAIDSSEKYPLGIMLGHLSEERNEPDLALDTVWEILDEARHGEIELSVAPR